MNKLSVYEFGQMCEDRTLERFVFDSSKQPRQDLSVGFAYKITTRLVYYVVHPNIICFKSDDQFLRFSDVGYVDIISDAPDDGLVFDIACKKLGQNRQFRKFRFVAF